MVSVTIMGVSHPLALTVAALDQIIERCDGIDGISDYLDGYKQSNDTLSLEKTAKNIPWILALFMREGAACAEIAGIKVPEPLTEDQLTHALSLSAAMECRDKIIESVNDSLSQSIEAEYPKNGKDQAEREA